MLVAIIVIAIVSFEVISCNKSGIETSKKSTNTMSKVSNAGDTVAYVSQFHIATVCPSSKDSVCTITLYHIGLDSFNYRYTISAPSGDHHAAYSTTAAYSINPTHSEADLTLLKDTSYYVIYFNNAGVGSNVTPNMPIKITFTCECCSHQGFCWITGSCCPNTTSCDASDCNGECGLNASSTVAVLSSNAGESVLVQARYLHCLN